MPTAVRKNSGFTLVEAMVAIVILFISMMALLWALSMAVQHNMQNLMMNEAVKIADDQMNSLRTDKAFADLVTDATGVSVFRIFRNSKIEYKVTWAVQDLSAASNHSRVIQVNVNWKWKNSDHRHAISSIVSTDI